MEFDIDLFFDTIEMYYFIYSIPICLLISKLDKIRIYRKAYLAEEAVYDFTIKGIYVKIFSYILVAASLFIIYLYLEDYIKNGLYLMLIVHAVISLISIILFIFIGKIIIQKLKDILSKYLL